MFSWKRRKHVPSFKLKNELQKWQFLHIIVYILEEISNQVAPFGKCLLTERHVSKLSIFHHKASILSYELVQTFKARHKHHLQTTQSGEVLDRFWYVLKYLELHFSELIMTCEEIQDLLLIEKLKMMGDDPHWVGQIHHQKRPPTEWNIWVTTEVNNELCTCKLNSSWEKK